MQQKIAIDVPDLLLNRLSAIFEHKISGMKEARLTIELEMLFKKSFRGDEPEYKTMDTNIPEIIIEILNRVDFSKIKIRFSEILHLLKTFVKGDL